MERTSLSALRYNIPSGFLRCKPHRLSRFRGVELVCCIISYIISISSLLTDSCSAAWTRKKESLAKICSLTARCRQMASLVWNNSQFYLYNNQRYLYKLFVMKLSYTSIHIIKSRRLDISINCCDIPKPINESQAVVTSNGFIGVQAHLAPASIIHAPTGGSIYSQTYPTLSMLQPGRPYHKIG